MYGNFKNKILELRNKGCTYNQIQNILNCSKGTISFHCGEGQKEKHNSRQRKRRSASPLVKKIETFCFIPKTIVNEHEIINLISSKTVKQKLRSKLGHFFSKGNRRKYEGYNKFMFTVQQLLEKIGENPVCYLTGTPIDLNKSRSYHLDHIVPKSRGGDDSLDNCQIACRAANQAKGDLLVEEFIELCKKVIEKKQ
jgi:5-methylcytosine-specific restriction endonuclease McrA